jgi:hypothetical protein
VFLQHQSLPISCKNVLEVETLSIYIGVCVVSFVRVFLSKLNKSEMEPNVGADIHMLVNESEFFIGKKKQKAKKLVTILSSHLRIKNSMRRNCINKELKRGPKEKILQLGFLFWY